jgi:hypothetical protein
VVVVGLRPRGAVAQQSPEAVWPKEITEALKIVIAELIHGD